MKERKCQRGTTKTDDDEKATVLLAWREEECHETCLRKAQGMSVHSMPASQTGGEDE